MFCQSCGKNLPDLAKFCTGCGTKITDDIPQYQTNQMQNPNPVYPISVNQKSPWPKAIGITFLVILAIGVINAASGSYTGSSLVLLTAIWAGIDGYRLKINRYKKDKVGISNPILAFLGVLLLWIFCFPYYLVIRENILNGTAQLKN